MRSLLGALLVLLCATGGAFAQIVRGTVYDQSTGAPLQGVFVVLIDSAGRMRGGTLSDGTGFYALRAPHEGSFTLRAERIGHESITTPTVVVTQTLAGAMDIRVPVAAIELAPIDVRGAKRCEVRQEQGRRTAQLWEEARKALTVAGWVEREQPIRFEWRSHTRELDPYSLAVRRESVTFGISGSRPYRAVSADSLARFGFVQNWGDDVVYYGPDAEVLLSDIFLEQHCFRSVAGTGENAGLIGLAFEPVRTRQLRDIEGTLWLDSRTLELRHIEYRYTNLPRAYNIKTVGGRTDFRRLSNGAWIVDRWYIRMPMTAISSTRESLRLTALREEGGEVIAIAEREKVTTALDAGVVAGAVYDSVRGVPLAGALVYLSGTSHQAKTNDAGVYAIENVPVGIYTLGFTHEALDSALMLPQPQGVAVERDDTTHVALGIASIATQIRETCNDAAETGVLFGRVRNPQGAPQPGAEVIVSFDTYERRMRTGPLTVVKSRFSVNADNAGDYMACSLPLDEQLQVTVTAGERKAKVTENFDGRRIKRLDIEVR